MRRATPRPPRAVGRITETLEAAGHETWAVGGAVRDALLGAGSGREWDLATAARPEDVQRLFPRTVPIGIDHGTVGVLMSGHLYEVTTFRRDVKTDGRHAVVSFSDTIEEDLSRRDFTINAIAWHPLEDRWLDPFGGEEDLERRVLRAVGDPAERFREDRLRVLRGLRFAGRLRLEIDPPTWAALAGASAELGTLSAERIREELVKVLDDEEPSRALELYRSSGALEVLYPALAAVAAASPDEFEETLRVVDAVEPHMESRMAALFLPTVRSGVLSLEALSEALEALRCSNRERQEVVHWVRTLVHGPPEDSAEGRRRWLARFGRDSLEGIARVWVGRARAAGDEEEIRRVTRRIGALRNIASSGVPLAVNELAVGGNDLKRMGLEPGPHFKRILDALLERVLENPLLNREESLQPLVREMAYEEGLLRDGAGDG